MFAIPPWFAAAWYNTAIRVDDAYMNEIQAPWRTRKTRREFWTFVAVLDGELDLRQGGWNARLAPGQQTILIPGHPFEMSIAKGAARLLTLSFRILSTLRSSNPLPTLGLPVIVTTEPTPDWKALCHRVAATCGPANPWSYKLLLGRGDADRLITAFVLAGLETGTLAVSQGDPIPDWLATIRFRITQGPQERIKSPAAMAREAGFSRSYFYREYRRVFGETPMASLWKRRLAVAAQKMEAYPQEPISAIAAECRFMNHSHFSKVFHTTFGMTPSAWRRRHQTEPVG